MMRKNKFLLFIFQISTIICFSQTTNYATYVNPFIGTGGAGHTFPGAVLPFGMVQLSPDTRIDGSWESCAGYHYSDSIIYGFTHTHLSGTGVSDYGDILIMPTVGTPNLKNTIYASKFNHLSEKAGPGYYQVFLDDDKIKAELTTTTRVGIHQYTFPKTTEANIILDLLHRDKTLKCKLRIIDSVTVVGYRISEAWATEQYVYFTLKFNKPFVKYGMTAFKETTAFLDNRDNRAAEGAFFQFDASDEKPIMVKVAISQTSNDGATKNLNEEAKHWSFDLYKSDAKAVWEKELSKIEIETTNQEQKIVFYSALYHTMIHPSVASDCDGKYRGRDNKIQQANGFTPYTVFSLWDTFRALHPLFTIIEQKRTKDFLQSFLNQYEQGGRLPMWELSANETNCMIGFHSVSAIADAFSKNIFIKDTVGLYNAMKAASNYDDFGILKYNTANYLQIDDEAESVSKTLEYAYDNWCIAQVALTLKKQKDYALYMKRAQGYKNVFDNKVGFMRPRKNGNWLSPFDAREVNNHYTEANAWQYTFFVPQDVSGMIKLFGGERKTENKLDELFTTDNKTTGRTQSDITGLIGQYAHGNEPSHHMVYLYNYIGKPYKAQELIYKIETEFYKNNPDGLIGNEDCGQMSAWYVMSAMGFYQVCPGKPEYTIGNPLFKHVKINLENGKTFEITKQIESDKFQYIKTMSLNGVNTFKNSLSHQSIVNGGKIEFTMNATRDTTSKFGREIVMRPNTQMKFSNEIEAPIISTVTKIVKPEYVTLQHPNKLVKLVYTTNGLEPTRKSKVYSKPFLCDTTTNIKAKAYIGKDSSSVTSCFVHKKPNNWLITIKGKYNSQYNAGGDDGIIDGLHGTINWRSGEWQGFQEQDFECIIDLQKQKTIQTISSSFLQDTRSWIIFPTKVEYYTSEDGKDYTQFGTIENGIPADDYSLSIRAFTTKNIEKTTARYVKIKAKNFGKLPAWHLGNGGYAFIFIDEIEVR